MYKLKNKNYIIIIIMYDIDYFLQHKNVML